MRRNESHAGKRCAAALAWCLLLGSAAGASAQGSVCKYVDADGNIVFSNLPPEKGMRKISCNFGDEPPKRSGGTASSTAKSTPTPGDFPRVDPGTQKGRDDVRRKVLGDELATEEQLLAEARTSYANGAPVPLPEEQANAEKYRERIARYRQAIQLHERNIEALKKELGNTK
ncbi:MAG TPA: DUF4124 domain-containing protein [Casimicrobiaceae bacterium]|nr:DUF4124 domain-containing protein [Casimicrobiaceae bacterium]